MPDGDPGKWANRSTRQQSANVRSEKFAARRGKRVESLEVRTKSFHDLLLQYDASQIDRTARVTHSDPCSLTGDCFQIGALGRGSGRQCAGAAVMKTAIARERLGAFRKHAPIR